MLKSKAGAFDLNKASLKGVFFLLSFVWIWSAYILVRHSIVGIELSDTGLTVVKQDLFKAVPLGNAVA